MGIKTLDWTDDISATAASPLSIVGATSGNSPIYDTNTNGPWMGKFRMAIVADAATPGSVLVVTVQGSNTSDFSGDKHTLANLIIGNNSGTGTIVLTGATDSLPRGTNDYVLWTTNQAQVGDRLLGTDKQISCRYLRIVGNVIGSAGTSIITKIFQP
jgi:hypothetical protein